MNRSHQTGRYRSGQTGQTVNLLALRLRWFESSPAQFLITATVGAGARYALLVEKISMVDAFSFFPARALRVFFSIWWPYGPIFSFLLSVGNAFLPRCVFSRYGQRVKRPFWQLQG